MDNFLEGGVAELEIARAALQDQDQKKQIFLETERTLKARQKELEIQKKRIEEKIISAVKKARAGLDKEYEGQIVSAEKAIKDAETKKKNAKAAAVNLRMKKENSSLLDENKVMQAEISQRFRQEGVPFVCRCRWYYSVFYPTDKLDFIVCAAILFLCVFLIPFIVTRFIDSVGVKILVWILIAAFFAGLYFLIKAWTQKGNRLDEIIKARSSIMKIAENRSRIKKINRNIKADPDESQYNLSEYDYMVDTARKECDEIKARRDEAVKYFEEKESVEIRTKMENEYAAVLEDLDKDIRQLQNELDERNAGFKAAVDESAVYAAALGDKYYKAEKIDELIGIISEGRAENIGQALETLTNKKAGTWQKTEEAETKEEE